MEMKNLEELEITLLLEAIFQRFGDDFRNHRKETIYHKIKSFMSSHAIATVSELQNRILHDATFIDPLLSALDARPVELFDSPEQWLKLRKLIVPLLRSSPAPKIWVAQCAAAEDVYGLAILLLEEDLYHKTQIYITGPNVNLLNTAREGKFPATLFSTYEKNYSSAGGTGSLNHYCEKVNASFVFNPELQKNFIWAQYNIGTDTSLNEFEVIICPGGLSNFTSRLQHRALQIFYDSQPSFGILCVACKSLPEITPFISRYKVLSSQYGIYQR